MQLLTFQFVSDFVDHTFWRSDYCYYAFPCPEILLSKIYEIWNWSMFWSFSNNYHGAFLRKWLMVWSHWLFSQKVLLYIFGRVQHMPLQKLQELPKKIIDINLAYYMIVRNDFKTSHFLGISFSIFAESKLFIMP